MTGFWLTTLEPFGDLAVFNEPAMDANGRSGRELGNEDARIGIGWDLIDDGARVREDEASGDDTNFDEWVTSKWDEYPVIVVAAARRH